MIRIRKLLFMLLLTACLCGTAHSQDEPEPILRPAIDITTQTLPSGYQGDEYSTLIEATGGPHVFLSASLPRGLRLDRSGHLSGTLKLGPGDHSLLVIAVDPDDPDRFDEKHLTLIIHQPLRIPGSTLAPAMAGTPYDQTVELQGGSPACRASVTGLPAGLAMDPTGRITGTCETGPARHKLALTFEDPSAPGHRVSKQITLTVYAPLTLTSASPAPLRVGHPLETALAIEGGSGSVVFSAENLPQGLTLDTASGRIGGIPQAGRGDYDFTVRATDQTVPVTVSKTLTLTLVDFHPDVYESLEAGNEGGTNLCAPGDPIQEHTFDQPGDRDTVFLDLRVLPPGDVIRLRSRARSKQTRVRLRLEDPSGNTTPAVDESDEAGYPGLILVCQAPGIYRLDIDEATGETGDYGLEFEHLGPRAILATRTLPDQQTPGPVDLPIEATDGSGTYDFRADGLPPGLDISAEGRIHGNLTAPAGVYPVTIHVRDRLWGNPEDSQNLLLTLVDFFPDADEPTEGTGIRDTLSIQAPGGPVRNHTFHTDGDTDAVKLDLSAVQPGHVIRVQTLPLTRPTPTVLTVIDQDGLTVFTDKHRTEQALSCAYLDVKAGDALFLTIEHPQGRTGDYALSVEDMGPRVRIATRRLPDALSNGLFSVQLEVADGSGSFRYSGETLPKGLSLDASGLLRGTLDLAPGTYHLTVRVSDTIQTGIEDSRPFDLRVVEYFPDEFEAMNDQDALTGNTLKPGESVQTHCFHETDDTDWVRLDLGSVMPNDVIIIQAPYHKKPTATGLRLFNPQGQLLGAADTDATAPGAKLVFTCAQPGPYLLEIRELQSRIGDYRLSVDNSGQPLALTTPALNHAESAVPHHQTVSARGGCGRYRFSISQGVLPQGLSFSPDTGTITGRNTNWGRFTVTVLAEDLLFPDNRCVRDYTMDAFMGTKLRGETRFVFPHYLSGTFSLDDETTTTRAFPGAISGGTPGNLRYTMVDHTIPNDRFTLTFDPRTGALDLIERSPVSCNHYKNLDLDVTVEVRDSVYTNNRLVFHYEIPARCLSY